MDERIYYGENRRFLLKNKEELLIRKLLNKINLFNINIMKNKGILENLPNTNLKLVEKIKILISKIEHYVVHYREMNVYRLILELRDYVVVFKEITNKDLFDVEEKNNYYNLFLANINMLMYSIEDYLENNDAENNIKFKLDNI
jgi:hypothetical protein